MENECRSPHGGGRVDAQRQFVARPEDRPVIDTRHIRRQRGEGEPVAALTGDVEWQLVDRAEACGRQVAQQFGGLRIP